jgi:hypothetical protein
MPSRAVSEAESRKMDALEEILIADLAESGVPPDMGITVMVSIILNTLYKTNLCGFDFSIELLLRGMKEEAERIKLEMAKVKEK